MLAIGVFHLGLLRQSAALLQRISFGCVVLFSNCCSPISVVRILLHELSESDVSHLVLLISVADSEYKLQ